MDVTTFIKVFRELRDKSPRVFSSSRDNENCLYTDGVAYSKNGYYLFLGGWLQDCYYGELLVKCQDCVDCTKVENSQLCYECTECIQCYNSNYLLKCKSVQDSEYCINLQDCSYCFLSGNLHHASYVFKNTKYSKEEYEKLVHSYKKEKSDEQLIREWQELYEKTPHLALNMHQCENCIGNELSFSKNVYMGFDLINAEDYLYSEEGGYSKDCCDTFLSTSSELSYECYGVSKQCYNCNFCVGLVTCSNCEFCSNCYDCSDCFGSVYLKGKKFYILNKPYSQSEYKREVDTLKKSLKERGFYNFDLMV